MTNRKITKRDITRDQFHALIKKASQPSGISTNNKPLIEEISSKANEPKLNINIKEVKDGMV